jgi:hypothetical protein
MARYTAASIDRWFFYQDVANLWKWARIDVFGTVLSYSGAAFATRDECIDDARRSGYSDEAAHAAAAASTQASGRRPSTVRAAPTHRY